MKEDKEDARQKIEEQTKAFLEKGGKIDYVEGSERNASYNITFRLGVKNKFSVPGDYKYLLESNELDKDGIVKNISKAIKDIF